MVQRFFIVVKAELKDLIKELLTKASDKWENMGILLGIEPGRLDAIKAAENQPQNCLHEILKIWLNRVTPPPSWSSITEAIDLLGDQKLADRLRTKYQVPLPNFSTKINNIVSYSYDVDNIINDQD